MNRFFRRAVVVFAAALLFARLLAPTAALAQAKKPDPKPEELKDYTLPYFFTVVGAAGVIVPICWPTGRKWEIKKTDDEE